jgi:hypothetical protein
MLRKLKQATPGGKEGKCGWCVDIIPPRCLCRRPVGERRKMWAVCEYHATPLFSSMQGGERREMQVVCGYHTAPLSWSMPGEGKKRKNVGGVWISCRPIVFVTPSGGKKENVGGVDITPPPLFLLMPRGGKEEKQGWRVDITSPHCLHRLWGGEEGKWGWCVGCTPPRCCCFPFASLTSSLPLVHPFPLHSSPPLLLDLLLLLTPLQPVVIVRDVAYTLLLDGKVAGGGRRRL